MDNPALRLPVTLADEMLYFRSSQSAKTTGMTSRIRCPCFHPGWRRVQKAPSASVSVPQNQKTARDQLQIPASYIKIYPRLSHFGGPYKSQKTYISIIVNPSIQTRNYVMPRRGRDPLRQHTRLSRPAQLRTSLRELLDIQWLLLDLEMFLLA